MAINSLADYEAALKTKIRILSPTGTSSQNSTAWKSITKLSLSGDPGAFATVSNTANGLVPVAGDTGFPALPTWPNTGYISHVAYTETAISAGRLARIILYDRLFHCGAYNTNNTSTTLTSQPSYSSRVPNSNYVGTQLWIESNTASGAPTLTVTYTDQSGNTGHSTSVTVVSAGSNNGICQQVPLASGDCGISKIESVTTTAVGSGTFNLFVARPIAYFCFTDYLREYIRPLEWFGPAWIHQNTALAVLGCSASSNTTPVQIDLSIEVASN